MLGEGPIDGINDSTGAPEKMVLTLVIYRIFLNFTLQWWWELLVSN